jgi:hypothetical protein
MKFFTRKLLPFQFIYKTLFENLPVLLTAAAKSLLVLSNYFVTVTELYRSKTPSVVDLLLSEFFYDLLLGYICIRIFSYLYDHILYSCSQYPPLTAWTRNHEVLLHFPGSESWNFYELNRRGFGDVRWPEHRVWLQNFAEYVLFST